MEAAGAGAGQPSSRLEAPESTDDRLFLIKGKYGHGCLTGERVYPCLESLGLGLTLCVVWCWCDQLRSLESFRSTQFLLVSGAARHSLAPLVAPPPLAFCPAPWKFPGLSFPSRERLLRAAAGSWGYSEGLSRIASLL
ncbi:transmembrane protein 242 isoform X4 [Lynx rufus]|uniref:transmembrane protein 242 isoform X4 n=1 Tax=Lynx rufus TaxID=61384 RepID=UPI001F12413D|nr:transmembrane protein 242 isoform X4 [Lynx rufus]